LLCDPLSDSQQQHIGGFSAWDNQDVFDKALSSVKSNTEPLAARHQIEIIRQSLYLLKDNAKS